MLGRSSATAYLDECSNLEYLVSTWTPARLSSSGHKHGSDCTRQPASTCTAGHILSEGAVLLQGRISNDTSHTRLICQSILNYSVTPKLWRGGMCTQRSPNSRLLGCWTCHWLPGGVTVPLVDAHQRSGTPEHAQCTPIQAVCSYISTSNLLRLPHSASLLPLSPSRNEL